MRGIPDAIVQNTHSIIGVAVSSLNAFPVEVPVEGSYLNISMSASGKAQSKNAAACKAKPRT